MDDAPAALTYAQFPLQIVCFTVCLNMFFWHARFHRDSLPLCLNALPQQDSPDEFNRNQSKRCLAEMVAEMDLILRRTEYFPGTLA